MIPEENYTDSGAPRPIFVYDRRIAYVVSIIIVAIFGAFIVWVIIAIIGYSEPLWFRLQIWVMGILAFSFDAYLVSKLFKTKRVEFYEDHIRVSKSRMHDMAAAISYDDLTISPPLDKSTNFSFRMLLREETRSVELEAERIHFAGNEKDLKSGEYAKNCLRSSK